MGAPTGTCQLSSGVHLSEHISLSDGGVKTMHTSSDSSGTLILFHMTIINIMYRMWEQHNT